MVLITGLSMCSQVNVNEVDALPVFPPEDQFEVSAPDLCKMVIATVMRLDISDLEQRGDLTFYKDAGGVECGYKCKLAESENRVIWGSLDGRWRDRRTDAAVYYCLDGNKAVISEVGFAPKTFILDK